MFRLAHISDIHLSPMPEPTSGELFSKRITGYLNWKRNRASSSSREHLDCLLSDIATCNPDHLAITGDLVNIASRSEIDNASNWLAAVSKQMGGQQNITAIAGNHDAYVPEALSRVLTRWGPFFWNNSTNENLSETDFPLIRQFGDVSIISCNSAEATLPFQAIGYFRKSQSERLRDILGDDAVRNTFRVVLIHHLPIENETAHHKRLVGAGLFNDVIGDTGAELVLHGHTHLDSLYWINGKNSRTPVVGVASAINAPGNTKPAGQYNLFDISGSAGKWKCIQRKHGYPMQSELNREPGKPVPTLLEETELT